MTSIKNMIIAGFVGCALSATTSCQKNEYGTIDLSGYTPEPEVTLTYNHPCALYSAADFARVRQAIANNSLTAAQQEEYPALLQSPYVMGDYGVTVHAHRQIVRGNPAGTDEGVQNYTDAMRDAAAAHQFGLLWQLTGNTTYAEVNRPECGSGDARYGVNSSAFDQIGWGILSVFRIFSFLFA